MHHLKDRIRTLFKPVGEGLGLVPAAPPVPVQEIFARFWPYARPYRKWLLLTLGFAALLPAIETAEIWLFQKVVDDVLVPRDLSKLALIAALYVGLNLISGLISYLNEYVSSWVGENFLLRLRTRLFEHVLRLDPDALQQRKLGDTITRFTSDVGSIETFVLWGITDVVSSVLRILFFGGAMFLLDPLLALLAFTVVPPFIILGRTIARFIKRAARERRRHSGSLATVIEENVSNLQVVQTSNQQTTQKQRFRSENEAVVDAGLAGTRAEAMLSPLAHFTELTTALVVIGMGTWALAGDRLTLGGLLAFLTYLTQLYRPLSDLTSLSAVIYSASAGAERVIEIFEQQPEVTERPNAQPLTGVQGRITLDDVTYRYPEARRDALQRVSLTIDPGQRVAIVGPSGAGKSTLAKLLVRFLDPTSGTVFVDDHDLRSVTLGSLRDAMGLHLQEAMLFDASVRDNIAFGRPDADDVAIEKAAVAAGAHDFIVAQRDGYLAKVGQKGRNLSGGQRQRVALARTLLRDCPIVVLDEPSVGLDADTTDALLREFDKLMEDRTSVVISHNLRLVHEADHILVLNSGRIVERGTHTDLLAKDGMYAHLYRSGTSNPRSPGQDSTVGDGLLVEPR